MQTVIKSETHFEEIEGIYLCDACSDLTFKAYTAIAQVNEASDLHIKEVPVCLCEPCKIEITKLK